MEEGGEVFEASNEDVDDFVLALEAAVSEEGGGAADDTVVTLPHVRADDKVHRAGFVLERYEADPLRGRGALT